MGKMLFSRLWSHIKDESQEGGPIKEHYSDATVTRGFDGVLAGSAVSVWEQVSGFSEW